MTPREARADETARRALARRRRRRRRRVALAWTILAGLGLVVGIAGALSWKAGVGMLRRHSRLLEIQRVDVSRTQWIPPWEVVDLSGVEPGDDILDLPTEDVVRRLVRHPRIESAAVRRGWDRIVVLEVHERAPLALWLGPEVVEIAADGTVLGPPPRGVRPAWPVREQGRWRPRGVDLPLLAGVGQIPPVGETVTAAPVLRALEFLLRVGAYGRPAESWISEIWVGNDGELTAVTLEGGIPILVGDGRLSRRKIEALHVVLDEVRSQPDGVDRVDARFRNQVIVRSS